MNSEQDFVDRFLGQSIARPDAPAVVARQEHVTYAQFERMVRQLAAVFVDRLEPKVLIALPQVTGAYASIFAAAMAGGFHTPLNLHAPIQKLIRVAQILRPDFIVGYPDTTSALSQCVPSARIVDPRLVADIAPLNGRGIRHRLAYVIFTSGSTGLPKGVMISRSAVNHYVAWLECFRITANDRLAQQANLAFDISMTDIFGALCYGATLYPLNEEIDRLMPALMIAREQITIWTSTPSVINLMMQSRQATSENLKSVRLFNLCGEPLLPTHLAALFGANPNVLVLNTYGPTEATVTMTVQELTAANFADHASTSISIGKPIEDMNIVLVGGAHENEGELVIIGPQLAEGYWNDSEKTSAAFKPVRIGSNIFRGYYTGDWVERRGEDIFFRERVDFQVKVRGHRVELDEVAAVIRNCGWPVAFVFKRGEALAAIVERFGDKRFDEKELRRAVAQQVESYAVPERIVIVDHIPRNENDKLDRKGAAALFELGPRDIVRTLQANRNKGKSMDVDERLERIYGKLRAIFSDVFPNARIELKPDTTQEDVPGWDSISYVGLIVAIEDTFGFQFGFDEIPGIRNINDLVTIIAQHTRNGLDDSK